MRNSPSSKRWVPALDGVRGLAILLVMLYHFSPSSRADNSPGLLHTIAGFGWSGVDLFFVLSGFLITGILLDSRHADNYFLSFYARRLLRILPLYYLYLFVAFVILPAIFEKTAGILPGLSDRSVYLIFGQNWIGLAHHRPQHLLTHYWSLAVEEQFYLAWPLMVAGFAPRRLLKICVGACLLAPGLRWLLMAHGFDAEGIYRNTLTRMDAPMIGAACALVYRQEALVERIRPYCKYLWTAPIAILAALRLTSTPLGNTQPVEEGVGYTLIALGYAALLLSVLSTSSGRFFTNAAMRTLGKYSYGAYVWHLLVQQATLYVEVRLLDRQLGEAVNIPVMIALTMGVSVCSYLFVERYFLSWKRYFEPRTSVRTERSPGSPSQYQA